MTVSQGAQFSKITEVVVGWSGVRRFLRGGDAGQIVPVVIPKDGRRYGWLFLLGIALYLLGVAIFSGSVGFGILVGLAASLFVVPVGIHAAWNWSPSDARPPSPLTAGLVAALREDVATGDVVYSDPETSYRIAAEAPVYIAAAPPGHVADTDANRPYERRSASRRFFRTGDLAITRAARAGWLVVDRDRFEPALRLRAAYSDRRFTLYRLGTPAQ